MAQICYWQIIDHVTLLLWIILLKRANFCLLVPQVWYLANSNYSIKTNFISHFTNQHLILTILWHLLIFFILYIFMLFAFVSWKESKDQVFRVICVFQKGVGYLCVATKKRPGACARALGFTVIGIYLIFAYVWFYELKYCKALCIYNLFIKCKG